MKQNEDGKTVRAMDVLFPKIGEIIGGSEREIGLSNKLMTRIDELHIPMKDMWWYLDTRSVHVLTPGFGLGFERLLLFVTHDEYS